MTPDIVIVLDEFHGALHLGPPKCEIVRPSHWGNANKNPKPLYASSDEAADCTVRIVWFKGVPSGEYGVRTVF